MSKFRKGLLLFSSILFYFRANAQADTTAARGFNNYREASDSLFARLMNKKFEDIRSFLITEKMFIRETRKTDTVIPKQMIEAQYISYWGRSERTYKKVYNKLKKSRVTGKRAVFDTVLVYRNTGNPDLVRAELYFSQKKYRAWVQFQLWHVDGLWYFNGRFELVEEKISNKKKSR